jgi:hypothetical protein
MKTKISPPGKAQTPPQSAYQEINKTKLLENLKSRIDLYSSLFEHQRKFNSLRQALKIPQHRKSDKRLRILRNRHLAIFESPIALNFNTSTIINALSRSVGIELEIMIVGFSLYRKALKKLKPKNENFTHGLIFACVLLAMKLHMEGEELQGKVKLAKTVVRNFGVNWDFGNMEIVLVGKILEYKVLVGGDEFLKVVRCLMTPAGFEE